MQATTETRADRCQYLRTLDEFLVTACCRVSIRHLDDIANANRLLDESAHVGRLLLCVAIQERLRRQPFQYPLQLPGKICSIANACTQPLAKERRRLMRGVTCEKNAAAAPALREHSAKRISDGALDTSLPRCNPRFEPLPHIFGLGKVCAVITGHQFDLPAVPAAHTFDTRDGPRRVANLHGSWRQRSHRLDELNIRHEPLRRGS